MSSVPATVAPFDLATVTEISRALSNETVLDQLMERLIVLAVERAGATRALLVLSTADGHRIAAEATAERGAVNVRSRESLASPEDLPESIVRHVLLTRDTVSVDDAASPNPFVGDEYLRRTRPRSILCLPLAKLARSIGVLYLENDQTPEAFTPARIVILGLLASQAAIALENARLDGELRQAELRLSALRPTHEGSAAEVLKVAAERLELALRGSKVGMWDFDLTSTGGSIRNAPVSWVNLWEALGYEPELPGPVNRSPRFHPERWHPEDRAPVLAALEAYLSGEAKEFGMEWRLIHRDGSVQWRLSRGVAVRDAAGTPTRFIGTSVDITDRKALEEQLLQAKEAAEAASRAKDDFLANVSHEIRTPMNAILGMTEMVLETRLTDEQRRALATVKSAADNLLRIIDDLLDFSKIEAGRVELASDALSLRAHVIDTVRPFLLAARRKGLKLTEEVAPDVPDGLLADEGRLRQIVVNLVGNAIKFTSQGEVSLRVEVINDDVTPTDDRVGLRFVVRDTGIGIPRDKQAIIFHAFAQQDTSTTRQYGGTGLGLTIAARLAKLMGGDITVASEPGRGSTFTFAARFATDASSSRAVHAPPSAMVPPTPAARRATRLRVLVAEDNDFNADLLRRLLEKRGHEAHVAMRGDDALTAVETGAFDLLLLDLHMPGADGFEVIQRIRERERTAGGHLPVIALTARSRTEDRDRCLAAGMDEFLAKPIHADALWSAIDGLVSNEPLPVGAHAGLVDARVLLAACGSDDVILDKIGRVLRAQLPAELAAAERTFQRGDVEGLRESAHKLHGMIAAASTSAGELASEIEDHANLGRLTEAGALLERLGVMVRQVLTAMEGISVERLRAELALERPD